MIIEDYIQRNSTLYPEKVAIVCEQETCTYKALQENIERRVTQLLMSGYKEGQIVCLRAHSSIDYLVNYFERLR